MRKVPCCMLVLAATAFAGGVDVLVLIPDGYGANTNFNRDLLEAMGWTLTTAAVTATVQPCHGALPVLTVDTLIQEIGDVTDFDAVAVMPCSWRYLDDPYGDLIDSPQAMELITGAVAAGMPVWTTCVGPRILAAAGLLQGVSIQGEPGDDGEYLAEYLAAGADYLGTGLFPVVDGPIVTTTREQYYQTENCEMIAEMLAAAGPPGDGSPAAQIRWDRAPASGASWSTVYGGSSCDGARALCPRPEGGWAVAGYTYSTGAGASDVLILLTDAEGSPAGSIVIGGPGWDEGNAILPVSEGGYLVAGSTTSGGAGARDMYLIRLDADLDTLWTRTYGGPEPDEARSVCASPDGGYLVTGTTRSSGSGENDVFLVRIDASGDTLWTRTAGGSGPETGDGVIALPDGGFAVAGSTGSFTANRDAFLAAFGAAGDPLWTGYYGATGGEGGYDRARAVATLPGGGFVLAGDSNGEDKCGAFLVIVDAGGLEIFKDVFGGTFYDYGYAVTASPDGGIVLCGSTKDHDLCTNDIYLLKVDASGQLVWEESFGTLEASEWGTAVCPTSDGGFVVAGQTASWGAGGTDVWLFRVEDPSVGTGEGGEGAPGPLPPSPNPCGTSVTLRGAAPGTVPVAVYDVSGRCVLRCDAVDGAVDLDVSSLEPGIYCAVFEGLGGPAAARFTVSGR